MLHLATFTFANIFGIPTGAVLIAFAGIVLGGVIVVSGMYFEHQRRRLWHETARLALEKGQPMPPMNDDFRQTRPAGPAHDFRAGLILVGCGVGLYYLLGPGIAAVVGFIGVALLVYALCAALLGRKKTSPVEPHHS